MNSLFVESLKFYVYNYFVVICMNNIIDHHEDSHCYHDQARFFITDYSNAWQSDPGSNTGFNHGSMIDNDNWSCQ